MQFAALGSLHCGTFSPNVSCTPEANGCSCTLQSYKTLRTRYRLSACSARLQPVTLAHGQGNCTVKALGIHGDVTFDGRDLVARVISLERCHVRIFDTLKIHDQERRAFAALKCRASFALIF